MNLFFFIIAVILLFLGHFIKVLRWKQFINIYEKPPIKTLYFSLGIGYLVNFLLPLHLGDFVRAFVSGKKLKNSFGFAFATVIVDRYLDIICVSIIFLFLYFTKIQTIEFKETIYVYLLLVLLLVILSFTVVYFSSFFKKIAKSVSSVFNSKLELKLLFFFWVLISTFKDLAKVNKLKLIIYTASIWFFYLFSYYFFALFWTNYYHEQIDFSDILIQLFSADKIDYSTLAILYKHGLINGSKPIIFLLYFLLPIIALLFTSLVSTSVKLISPRHSHIEDKDYLHILPFSNHRDKYNFLDSYFNNIEKDFLINFIEINRDISILKDYSAGSKATTMLCMNNKQTFFRKYTFGEDSVKLKKQIDWLQRNSDKLLLPKIIKHNFTNNLCSYDMEYRSTSVGFFNFIHSNPISKSWDLIKDILTDLETNLYKNSSPSKREIIVEYIESKVVKNIRVLKHHPLIQSLSQYDYLYINGNKIKNLPLFENQLDSGNLINIFSNDLCNDIHGDLTVENIICDYHPEGNLSYYLIDPNDGNIHDTAFLDYAKLLQSLHGGYEFLMLTQKVSHKEDKIDFLFTKSEVYSELLIKLKEYLINKFGENGLKSIFHHEIVHWLRLLPYKLEKSGERALIFYAGFLLVLNDVIED